jgi:hypothetical protein
MRFEFVQYDEQAKVDLNFLKKTFVVLEVALSHHKEGRSKSLALTHLEESFMWVSKMIRDEQIARNQADQDGRS